MVPVNEVENWILKEVENKDGVILINDLNEFDGINIRELPDDDEVYAVAEVWWEMRLMRACDLGPAGACI